MNAQDIRNLQEAYLEVYQEQELDEGRRTSLSALSRESAKRRADKERGRPETESEIHGRLAMGDFRPGASQEERARGGRQRLKDRGKVPQKGGKDMFEQILEHLVSDGYADTEEAAIAIMVNMSEEWKDSILEARYGGYREAIGQSDSRRLGRNPRYGSLSDEDESAAKRKEDAAAEAAKRRLRANLEREKERK